MITTLQRRWRIGMLVLALILVLQLLIGATVAGAASPVYHVVQWGENLTSIAYQYGTSPWDIANANGIWNPNLVYVGQVLYIPHPWAYQNGPCSAPAPCGSPVYYVPRPVPAPCGTPCGRPVYYVPRPVLNPCNWPCGRQAYGRAYIVRPGDTLTWIAMRYGTSVWAIVQANGLSNPNVIYTGQRLFIPV